MRTLREEAVSGAVIAALGIILVAVLIHTAAAITVSWSGDVQLTNTTAQSQNPELAIDGGGNIHIIYTTGGVPYYAKLSPGGSLAITTRLTDQSPGTFESGIAVDPLGNIHLVWRDRTAGYNLIYEKLNPLGSIAVNETQVTFARGAMPSLAVDPNGNPSIVFAGAASGGTKSSVTYMKLDDRGGIVTSPKALTDTLDENWGPAVAVDRDGSTHLLWSDRRQYDEVIQTAVYYAKLDVNGRVLINNTQVSTGSGRSTNPLAMALDSKMNVYIAWVDNRDGNWEIYYAKLGPNGAILRGDTRLTNDNATSWKPRIAVGPDDALHLVWEDDRDGNKEIYYKRLDPDGNVLVNETRLTYNLATSQNPDIAIDSAGVVHVIWEQDGEIYYKKSVP